MVEKTGRETNKPVEAADDAALEKVAGGFNPQPEPPPALRRASELSNPLEALIQSRLPRAKF